MSIIKEILIAALLCALCFLGLNYWSMSKKVERLPIIEAELIQAKETQIVVDKVLTARAVVATKSQITKEKSNAATQKALSDNADWAGQHVPDDVIDALSL